MGIVRIIIKRFTFIKHITSLLLLLSVPLYQAQTIQNNFVHFTESDGLISNGATAILQDHLGYIWIGTNNGLSRYDGYNFLNYTPVPNDSNFLQLPLITSLFEDSNGDIWIVGNPRISGLDEIRRNEIEFYNTPGFQSWKITIEEIRFISTDVALVESTGATNLDTETIEEQATWVVSRRNDEWRIAAVRIMVFSGSVNE